MIVSDFSMKSQALVDRWLASWPEALASWSSYTLLREPVFFEGDREAQALGMAGQIAAIRLHDHSIMINLQQIKKLKIEDFAVEILAHEIGHHVYVPGNLTDNARMISAMRLLFMGLPKDTPHYVANLYGDLHINDRLQRSAQLKISAVYERLNSDVKPGAVSKVWQVYTRAYEHLWTLKPGTLAPGDISHDMNADAALIARLIRHYAGNWLRGVRRFSFILYPYLVADNEKKQPQTLRTLGLNDTQDANKAGAGQSDADVVPDGLTAADGDEAGDNDDFGDALGETDNRGSRKSAHKPENTVPTSEQRGNKGQHREPFEYGELLKALGLNLNEHEVTTRYYRERALPHLLPFPAKKAPAAREPLAEGYETWDAGEGIEDLDLIGTVTRSPYVIPGITTVKRVYGETPGTDPAKVPLDLDIYVDSSGSMPNPAISISYLALAGTILALSALRAGARVQATVWSGPGQFETTKGFIRDEKKILGIVTGYVCGSTAFPLHVLRDTYKDRKPSDPPAHIVVISDEGVDTILAKDEKGNSGASLCEHALQTARGGGTLVLNLFNEMGWPGRAPLEKLGFKVHAVRDWTMLIAFARAFVRENYK
jgi:hypothetical protein